MNNINKACLLICIGAIAFSACKAKKKEQPVAAQPTPKSVCDDMVVGYQSHIKAIMDEHCVNACHNARKRAGGIDLSTYESMKYEATGIRFMGSLDHEEHFSPMPKDKPKLSDSTRLL